MKFNLMFMYFIKHKIYTVNQIHVIQYNYVYNVSNPSGATGQRFPVWSLTDTEWAWSTAYIQDTSPGWEC